MLNSLVVEHLLQHLQQLPLAQTTLLGSPAAPLEWNSYIYDTVLRRRKPIRRLTNVFVWCLLSMPQKKAHKK
jgi:hypothetical protein